MKPRSTRARAQRAPASDEATAGALIDEAMGQFRQGALAKAIPLFERALEVSPNAATALHFLGLSHHQLTRSDRAVPLLQRALELDPGQAAYAINLGLILSELSRLDEAFDVLDRTRQRGKPAPELLNCLGHVQLKRGLVPEAIGHFKRALELQPAFPAALNNLGSAYARAGRMQEAITAFESAQRLAPQSPGILNNLARAHAALGQARQAADCYESAIAVDPGNLDAALGLAKLLEEEDQAVPALKHCEAALAYHPNDPRLLLQKGGLLRGAGQFQAALACFDQAAAAAPRFFPARWQAELSLPVFCDSHDQMDRARERWMHGVETLQGGLDRGEFDADTVTLPGTNFYLHYQCGNDFDAQARYGGLVTRIAGRHAAGLEPPKPRSLAGGRKIRVGFASSFFNLHTIFKLFHGWIVHLDRSRFDPLVFHFGGVRDKATDFLEQHAAGLFAGAPAPRAAAEALLRADLDILIYPDVGMDGLTQVLAAMRLAPIQCQSWGHPVTSGLATIDFFLSSGLMEPDGAQAQYHEKLICLPNLSICYPQPDAAVAVVPPGLPAGGSGPLFVCLQSLFKLLPRQDALLARIAARVPESRFLFIRHPSPGITDLCRSRLNRALSEAGLDPRDRIQFLPPLKYGEFLGLARHADVILDSVGWSGGNTTLEALTFSKPVVTLPGENLRGRHTMAILRRIGVTETIARDEDDYVELAVRLAQEPDWRGRISERMSRQKALAYGDRDCVRSLETILQGMIDGSVVSSSRSTGI
jgi:predicted O-linked N-acetylglucosamine transferase (SPINDLY family)